MTTGLKHELYLNGSWRDISGDVRGTTSITRGRGEENTQGNPAKCSFVLDNRNGDYVLDNPSGAWYGYLTRNVPHRASVDAVDPYLYIPGGVGTATTPDSASLSLTGDLTILIDLWLPDWGAATDLIGKWVPTGNQRSFVVYIYNNQLNFAWSHDGTSTYLYATSDVFPWQYGRYSLAITYDYDNGAGGREYNFYYSTTPGLAGPWTALGPTVTGGTPATTYDGTAPLFLGDGESLARFYGRIFEAKLLSGAVLGSGTEVANPDFTAQSGGTSSFDDDAGNTWTVNGTASIVDRDWLFHGQIPAFPPEWDETGNDSVVPVASVDLQRRVERVSKNKPAKSAYYRGCNSPVAPITNLVAYWPFEDGSEATDIAAGIEGGHPMAINGDPSLASNTEAFLCSAALPEITDSTSFGGPVSYYASTDDVQVFFLLSVPEGGVSTAGRLMVLLTSGAVSRWELSLSTGGDLTIVGKDSVGSTLYTDTGVFGLNGKSVRVGIHLSKSGSDTDVTMSTLEPQSNTGYYASGTLSSYLTGACTWVAVNPDTANAKCVIGHITVQSSVTGTFDFYAILAAHYGSAGDDETAGSRISRIASEDDLPIRFSGYWVDSFPMGAQRVGSALDLIRECEVTDGGIFASRKDEARFMYRTRHSMEAQPPRLTLSYTDSEMSPPFSPITDDQGAVNKLTLSRKGGASYTYEDTDSSADPEDGGIGLYEQAYAVSLEYDYDVRQQCRWRVHLGAEKGPRAPQVVVDLSRSAITGDAALLRNVIDTDLGDRLVITDPPSNYRPDDIDLLVVGISETVDQFRRVITFVCVPERPYHTARFSEARFYSLGTTLNGAHNSTTTSLSVYTPTGDVWTDSDGDFDILVSGERMTVTAVTGSTASQTFTVTRSVNGVVKSHVDSESVDFFDPQYVANRG